MQSAEHCVSLFTRTNGWQALRHRLVVVFRPRPLEKPACNFSSEEEQLNRDSTTVMDWEADSGAPASLPECSSQNDVCRPAQGAGKTFVWGAAAAQKATLALTGNRNVIHSCMARVDSKTSKRSKRGIERQMIMRAFVEQRPATTAAAPAVKGARLGGRRSRNALQHFRHTCQSKGPS